MTSALVLSGGGANGAFQAGAISALYENRLTFDVISGVSVGALNGALVASGRVKELKDIWGRMENGRVYSSFGKWLRYLLLRRTKALYSTAPLARLLEEEIEPELMQSLVSPRLFVGVAHFETGNYVRFDMRLPRSREEVAQILLASSAVPFLFPPVRLGRDFYGVDGGTLNNNPLGDVLPFDPSFIVVINCKSGTSQKVGKPKNAIHVAKRALGLMFDEAFRSDQESFFRINKLVKQAREIGVDLLKEDGKPYKYFDTLIIEPKNDLGDFMDFSPSRMISLFDEGYELTCKLIEG